MKRGVKGGVSILLIVVLFMIVICSQSVSAIVNVTLPSNGSNYTSTSEVTFNVTFQNGTDINFIDNTPANINATFYFVNSSTTTRIGNSSNCSNYTGLGDDTNYSCWGSITLTSITDGFYNVTAQLINSSGFAVNSSIYISRVTVDSTPPGVSISDFVSPVSGNNYSSIPFGQNVSINVTISDGYLDILDVIFNITNVTGVQNMSIKGVNLAGSNASGGYWTASFNTTHLVDTTGPFNITILVNDSNGNLNQTTVIRMLYFDRGKPMMNESNITAPVRGANHTGNLIINVSAADNLTGIQAVIINITNATSDGTVNASYSATYLSGNWWNYTLNTAHFVDGKYNITIIVNDSAGNYNDTAKVYTVRFDNTAPTAAITCTPTSATTGATVTCSCTSGSDAMSGINTSYGTSGYSFTASPSTTNTGTHTETCSVYDLAGNRGEFTTTFSISSPSGGTGSSGSSSSTRQVTTSKVQSWTSIDPGTTATMKNFNENIGIKQIEIEVKGTATNAKVTVTSYGSSKPSAVPTAKSGDVYKYIEIKTNNLADDLDKAKVKLQVEKVWMSGKGLDKNNLAMFRFSDSKWSELPTSYVSEDADYYYYTVDLTGFSYFAIAQKAAAAGEGATEYDEDVLLAPEGSLNWLWIVLTLSVIAIAIIIWLLTRKKKK